jgi:hypothetical protein
MEMDSIKEVNQIVSYKLFAFLGDIGGIQQASYLILSTFGCYFSSQFYQANFIENIATVVTDGKSEKIKFGFLHILFQPIVSAVVSLLCLDKCLRDKF